MTEVRLMDAKRVISRKIEQAKRDASDAAKWRTVEPLLREWVEAEAALAKADWISGELESACACLQRTGGLLWPTVRSLLATDVNQGLTKEPRRPAASTP